MRVVPVVAALCLFAVAGPFISAQAHQTRSSPFCADDPNDAPKTPPVMMPVDEAPQRPDFLRFRDDLKRIAARRDESALLRVANPNIKLSFGDSAGVNDLRKLMRGEEPWEGSDFWREFARVLELGGTFADAERNNFIAPYVYSQWPDGYAVFDCAAVTGRNVRVRAQGRGDSRIVTTVSYAIVEVSSRDEPLWTPVGLADGRHGYIASRYLYSPIGNRAFFSYADGRWTMDVFIGGD